MYDHSAHNCGKIGQRTALLCAAIGFVLVLLMIGGPVVAGGGNMLQVLPFLLLPMLAIWLTADYLGFEAGQFLCECGTETSTYVLTGIILAIVSVAAGSLAFSFSLILRDIAIVLQDALMLLSIIITPLILILGFGAIPAALLGILYGVVVKKRLENE